MCICHTLELEPDLGFALRRSEMGCSLPKQVLVYCTKYPRPPGIFSPSSQPWEVACVSQQSLGLACFLKDLFYLIETLNNKEDKAMRKRFLLLPLFTTG